MHKLDSWVDFSIFLLYKKSMNSLSKALEETGLLKVDVLHLLEAYKKKTGIKVSFSKQALYNWLKKDTVPTSDTRLALVKVINAVCATKGLEMSYKEADLFPALPSKHYHRIDAEKILAELV